MKRVIPFAAAMAISAPAWAGDWQPISDMATERLFHAMAALPGSEALVIGGCTSTSSFDICHDRTATAEIFDGATKFPTVVSMSSARSDHTATTLKSGDVIVVGGCSSVWPSPYNGNITFEKRHPCTLAANTADLFQTIPKTFAAVQPGLVQARTQHTATLILGGAKDGQVLVAGGFGPMIDGVSPYADSLSSVELYDPGPRTFTQIGNMAVARARHTATLLVTGPHAGKVLLAGGLPTTTLAPIDGGPPQLQKLASVEVFDPATGISTNLNKPMSAGRAGHSAARLGDGRVLVVSYDDDSLEIFDPVMLTWSAGPSQGGPHDAALLLGAPVDQVLIFGETPALLFDPIGGKVRATGAITLPFDIVGLPLPNGRALATGGRHNGIDPPVKTAFVYSLAAPGESCKLDTDCRLHSCIDGVCCKAGCDVPCGSCDSPTGDCRKVTGMDHPSCVGMNADDRRTCDANGACKKKQGVFCDQADLCITGFCADGFCCESACTSACVACDFPTAGLCVPVAPQPVNGRPKCPSGQFCSGGGPDCVPAYCDGDHTLRRPRRPDVDCAPYRCAPAGACFERCNSVDQCSAPNVCDSSGHCVPIGPGDGGCALAGDGGSASAAAAFAMLALVIGRRARRRSARG
jgi:hypothetical protein